MWQKQKKYKKSGWKGAAWSGGTLRNESATVLNKVSKAKGESRRRRRSLTWIYRKDLNRKGAKTIEFLS
jgi:hypothetical protein